MNKVDNFKEFVKNHPELIKYVKSGEMTWQKFYEMYDIYGEKDKVWDEYLVATAVSTSMFSDIFSFFKNIDLDKMQEGINSIERVVGVLQDFGHEKEVKPEYTPRPLYKHFED